MNGPIPLRAHHGLCLQFFEGRGYGDDFVRNMTKIWAALNENPEQPVILRRGTDRICGACPRRRGGVCETPEKTFRYDAACLALCGLSEGTILSWGGAAAPGAGENPDSGPAGGGVRRLQLGRNLSTENSGKLC